MFGFGKKASLGKIPTQFSIPISRKKADGGVLQFDALVSGYFVGTGGKAAFTITSISANRIPNMDIESFNPSEIAEIQKHALEVEYKKLIGGR